MGSRGPSPLVPSLMVGVLGLVILGPTILSLVEYVQPLFEALGEDTACVFVMALPILLLLLIHLLSWLLPHRRTSHFAATQPASTSGYDAGGFGLGSIILVVLFFVLYNIM